MSLLCQKNCTTKCTKAFSTWKIVLGQFRIFTMINDYRNACCYTRWEYSWCFGRIGISSALLVIWLVITWKISRIYCKTDIHTNEENFNWITVLSYVLTWFTITFWRPSKLPGRWSRFGLTAFLVRISRGRNASSSTIWNNFNWKN